MAPPPFAEGGKAAGTTKSSGQAAAAARASWIMSKTAAPSALAWKVSAMRWARIGPAKASRSSASGAGRPRSRARARQAVEKAGQYAYRDRKVKKRTFRALWIQRINAAVRAEGLTYSQFIHGTKLAGIELDRKAMADLAMNEGGIFSTVIAQAKAALPA